MSTRAKEPVFTERELLRACSTEEQKNAMAITCQYVGWVRAKSCAAMMWHNPPSIYSEDIDPENPRHWDGLGT